MAYQFSFDQLHKYDAREGGITVKAVLQRGDRYAYTKARIDTGAQVCLFSREIGEDLGIDIESGLPRELKTINGISTAYGHEVTLQTLGLTFYTVARFAKDTNLPRNLLGRQGWLRLVRLAVVDYDEELYLSPYDEQT